MLRINNHALLEFEVLKQVEKSPLLTNRKMAVTLGVSVKNAHTLLAEMVKRGLFHIKKHHSRRWDYFLTPMGIAEKLRLTREFLEFSMQFYKEARKASSQVCRDIAASGKKKVAFLGTGELAEIAYLGIREWNLELIEIFGENESTTFLGLPVTNPEKIRSSSADAIIVCFFNKNMPMSGNYLSPGISKNKKMHWIFS